jgi:hypothetical protein
LFDHNVVVSAEKAPGGIPIEIFSLHNLEVLSLQNLLIKSVPDNIQSLTKLRSLVLMHNHVLDSLSPQVANVSGLEGTQIQCSLVTTILMG